MWVFILAALLVPQAKAPLARVEGALTDSNCPLDRETVLVESTIRVLARCHREPEGTVVHLATVSDIDVPSYRIMRFTVEFCGNAIRATGPEGWLVETTRVSNRATEIAWSAPSGYRNFDVLPGGRTVRGFQVLLARGWRSEGVYSATYEAGGVAAGASPHGCRYK
jgi:hypothetical protein